MPLITAASRLSFPVASFVSLAVLLVGLSSGTVSQVVEEGREAHPERRAMVRRRLDDGEDVLVERELVLARHR